MRDDTFVEAVANLVTQIAAPALEDWREGDNDREWRVTVIITAQKPNGKGGMAIGTRSHPEYEDDATDREIGNPVIDQLLAAVELVAEQSKIGEVRVIRTTKPIGGQG